LEFFEKLTSRVDRINRKKNKKKDELDKP